MTTNGAESKLPEKHRRIAVWYRRQAERLLEQAEWHDQRAARLETGVEVIPAADEPEPALEHVANGRPGLAGRVLVVAGIAGLIAAVRKLRG